MAIRLDRGRDKTREQTKKTKEMVGNLKDTAQARYGKAKDTAQSTYADMQNRVNFGLSKTQAALIAGLGLAQGLMKLNQQKTQRDLKMARKNARKTMRREVRPRWEKAQDAISSGLDTAQNMLSSSIESAQDMFAHNTKKASKNLKKAQKNLKKSYRDFQSAAAPTFSRASDMLYKVPKQAGQMVSSASGFKESMQDQYKNYQRKRARARTLFRIGLVVGVVMALLYAPYPGSELRDRIAAQWRKYRASMGL